MLVIIRILQGCCVFLALDISLMNSRFFHLHRWRGRGRVSLFHPSRHDFPFSIPFVECSTQPSSLSASLSLSQFAMANRFPTSLSLYVSEVEGVRVICQKALREEEVQALSSFYTRAVTCTPQPRSLQLPLPPEPFSEETKCR